MALGYTPKPLPQMNMGIQPQLPQPNGFGVFGNDQMLRKNLLPSMEDLNRQYDEMLGQEYRQAKSEGRALPPDVGNRRISWIQEQLRGIQSGAQGQGSYNGMTYDGFTMGPESFLWKEGKIPNRRGEYVDPKTGQIINPTANGNLYGAMGDIMRRKSIYETLDGMPENQARDYLGRISDDEAKKLDPKGKQGLLDYLVKSLKDRKNIQPRKFPWSSGEPAPERDWEAIRDFQRTLGMRGGKFKDLNANKALQYPDMLNQSFGNSLTLTNLTPKMRADLEKQGFRFKTWDETRFPGMNKLGDGKLGMVEFGSAVDAFKAIEKLKAAGVEYEVQPVMQMRNDLNRGYPGPTPKEQKLGKETSQVLAKTLFG